MDTINLNTIHEQFIQAAKSQNKQYLKDLLNHPCHVAIDFTDNDYEALKLIEQNHSDLLEICLLNRIKNEGRVQQGNSYIDANTYYCVLSSNTKQDSKLALNILIKANEYLHNISDTVKTPEFLRTLSQHYEQDIFDFEFIYTHDYKQFLLDYIKLGHKLSKKIKLSEDLLNDRDFIYQVSQYDCNLFYFVEHIYGEDLDIMKHIAMNEKQSFQMLKDKIRNTISEDENTALKILEKNPLNFEYLNKKMQQNINCIHKVLSIKPAMYEVFLGKIKNDIKLTIDLIQTYDIDINFLSEKVKDNREIAIIMTSKNGNNLEQFPLYSQDRELIDLALQTSKKVSLIPQHDRTWEKIENIILSAKKEENSFNLHYLPRVMKEDQSLIFKILEKDVFFKEDIFTLVNDYGNHRQNYDIVKKCIQRHPDLYGRFYAFKEDHEIIHLYIENMKKERNGKFSLNLIPQKIQAEASILKAPVDKYVLNKTMEKKSQNWKKDDSVKSKRFKI